MEIIVLNIGEMEDNLRMVDMNIVILKTRTRSVSLRY